jgi:DNA-3-methyladenine glycosylase II
VAIQSRALTRLSFRLGVHKLVATDPDLARVYRDVGEPPFWARRPGFATLVRIILEQQVSLTSAHATFGRLAAYLGRVDPRSVAALRIGGLRKLGLTRQKAAYCYGLAARVLDGTLDLGSIARGPDEAGRSALDEVPGLGPWSVDIYYLMALRRPDVWPQGDLALAAALREVKKLRAHPSEMRQQLIASRWSPWRSIAARMLWAHYLAGRKRLETDTTRRRPERTGIA